jgi:LuxR family maltose regulon positive regulatory protein
MSPAGITLSRTKLVIPSLRPEIMHRARLLALFDDVLEKKLILITAPAGYGKTSLLIDMAHQSEMPVCWLSLDALDKDPQRFFAYLIASLAQRFPKFGRQSNAALRSLVRIEQDGEQLLSAIVNEIDARIDEHFVLVVDDYQFVDVVAEVRDLFSRFVYLAGENCHVILASRRLPTLPDIALMVARQQVGGFDMQQLAFRPDEIRALFARSYGVTLDEAAVQELMLRTEGWITGLHLSAGGVPRGAPDLGYATRIAGVNLADYLDQQVLSQQPADVRDFLLKTSLFDEFDVGLCQAVLGPGSWKKTLEAVRRGNLFVLPVGPDGKWLRYHHIFQEFLQERIRQEDPQAVKALLRRSTEVYEERREWEKAYAACRQLGDPEMLAGVIERAGTPMLLGERLVTLHNWLEELPHALLVQRPSLLSLKGALLCAQGDGHGAMAVLDKAISQLRKESALSNLALALVRRAAANRIVGNYAASIQDADEALSLGRDEPDLQSTCAEAERFKGLCLYHLGQIPQASQIFEQALEHYRELGEKESIARVQADLGMTYRAGGNYPAASHAYGQALSEWRRAGNLYWQAIVLNSLGVLHHYQGEYEQAARSFEAGLECARLSHSPWHESLLLASLGDLYTDLDEYESAEQAYGNAAEVVQSVSHQFLTDYLCLAHARLARLRGQVEEARVYLDKAEVLTETAGSNYECGLYHLERGCLMLVKNAAAGAVPDLEQALGYFRGGNLAVETAWARVWLAAAYLGAGDVVAARPHLDAVLQIGPSEPLSPSLLQAVRQARPWLELLHGDSKSHHLLASWWERVGRVEARLPGLRKRLRLLLTTVPIRAPSLTVQAFGKTQVRVNGKLVTSAQWKTASVRELFFFFLAASRAVTKDEIGEILWPDLDAAKTKLRFKNQLYRLRHALGQNVVLFENNHYRFNRLLDYDYDVEDFETSLAKAKSAASTAEKIAHLRRAVSLKRGVYLQDVDANWIWPDRERLEQAVLNALKQLAELQRRSGDLETALQTCQEALKVDPCREEIHYLAMQIHAERGDRLAVIWQYQACRDALRSELDVEPSADLEALYRQLTA